MNKITIRGIRVSYDTVHEQLKRAEHFLEEDGLHTIGTITPRLLAAARSDEAVRKMTEAYDIAVVGEGKLLRGTGADSASRIREIHGFDFFLEFLSGLSRRKNTVFLLSDTRGRLEDFKAILKELDKDPVLLGEGALADHIDDSDAIVNEINAISPDIVLSVIGSPEQEQFLFYHRHMLGTKLWYSVGDFEKLHKKMRKSSSFFKRFVVD